MALGGKAGPGWGRAGEKAGCAGQGVAWLELGEEGEGGGKWGRGEQDTQGLLGHRKDLTGSQTSDVICLRFYQDF